MTKKALICGSIAFDTIMNFEDQFKKHILPDQVHILNVSFLVPRLRKDFGGCAGNIAYSLHQLGGHAIPMATVGHDCAVYIDKFSTLGIQTEYLKIIPSEFTAQAFITTDLDDNQITAFHPGAMNYAHLNTITSNIDCDLAIIAPDGRQGMIDHAEQLASLNIPFIFDPGQGLPMFDGKTLKRFLELATYAAVNDYEAKLLCEKTNQSLEQLASTVTALFVTRGAQGSWLFYGNQKYEIPAVKPTQMIDPTGCGDAYRGGLLFGLLNDLSLQHTAKLASLMGSVKIAYKGGQNYQITASDLYQRFEKEFGHSPW